MAKKFKIIKLVNKTTVLINAGKADGVKKDDKFRILDDNLTQIVDPDTDEILDEYYRFKQALYVDKVNEKYSVCVSQYSIPVTGQSLASKIINTSGSSPFTAAMDIHKTVKTYGNTMNVDEDELDDVLSEYNHGKVHVGDEVEPVK